MNWEQTIPPYILKEMINNTIIADCIRAWRNRKLAASDWTQLPDAPVDAAVWADYRQQLREMLKQNDDPKLIVFPEPPK